MLDAGYWMARHRYHPASSIQHLASAMSVRTRFAPSPTGYLHIGGVRTALFNWLFAKGQGGPVHSAHRRHRRAAERRGSARADPARPEMARPRLGRRPRRRRAARAVLPVAAARQVSGGRRASCSPPAPPIATSPRPEELQAERDAAQKAGRPFVYSRRWRAETDADAKRFEAEGRQGVVRLLMPREGQFVLNDLVRGEVRVDWASEQDHVIQRADGTCLYHLATVVDDHDMQISHVIRAEEHLSNTPRQVFMFERLGYELPQFAHLPYVAEPGSKTKLSKRKLDKYLKNRDFAAADGARPVDRHAAWASPSPPTRSTR